MTMRKNTERPMYVCVSVRPIISLTLENSKATIVPHRIIWSWYTGRWWVGCYIWYSEEGTGRRRSPPMPLGSSLYQNVTAHLSTASIPITDGPLLCGFSVAIKGLKCYSTFANLALLSRTFPVPFSQRRWRRVWVTGYWWKRSISGSLCWHAIQQHYNKQQHKSNNGTENIDIRSYTPNNACKLCN